MAVGRDVLHVRAPRPWANGHLPRRDVVAPSLDNLGAALQQVGSLMRLYDLTPGHMGEAGLRQWHLHRLPTALEPSLSDEGAAMSRSGPRPYRRRLFGFLTPMPRGGRIFS